MACIKIEDLEVLEAVNTKKAQGIFGGFQVEWEGTRIGLLGTSYGGDGFTLGGVGDVGIGGGDGSSYTYDATGNVTGDASTGWAPLKPAEF